jgi:hypothetical protein
MTWGVGICWGLGTTGSLFSSSRVRVTMLGRPSFSMKNPACSMTSVQMTSNVRHHHFWVLYVT